jgi:hypothetical protein
VKDRLPASQGLRICVVHHHLFPFIEPAYGDVSDVSADPPQDLSLIVNAAEVQKWLIDNKFQVVLHGHKHRPHGRSDTLWHPHAVAGSIAVIAAGSAGVNAKGLGQPDALSYNLVEAHAEAGSRWQFDVNIQEIVPGSGTAGHVQSQFKYGTSAGEPLAGGPMVFHAETIPSCHALIKRRCEVDQLLHNFVCIVESAAWQHPQTAEFQGRAAEEAEVIRSFRTLHPEYEVTNHWNDLGALGDALRTLSPRYQFQHGPRLFGPISRTDGKTRPIEQAVYSLKSNQRSHAYVGLYRPEIDAIPQRQDEPLPGLMSLQFVDRAGRLDAVATFRKIELSFWWPVNMYEVGQLLIWAASKHTPETRKPGRIVFFAALAEWKSAPEATLVSKLDEASLPSLVELVIGAHSGSGEASNRLRELLDEKRQLTDTKNLDPTGVKRLAEVVTGVRKADGALTYEFVQSLDRAHQAISTATRATEDNVNLYVENARESLEAARAALPTAS